MGEWAITGRVQHLAAYEGAQNEDSTAGIVRAPSRCAQSPNTDFNPFCAALTRRNARPEFESG